MHYSGITNKVAVVTEAAEGIGYAIVSLLLKAGAKVVLNDINKQKAVDAVTELTKDHPKSCSIFSSDAGDVEPINALVDFTLEQYGRLDFTVPNTGITLFGIFWGLHPPRFKK